MLLGFGVLALLFFGWLIAERLVGKARLAKYERVLRSKGEKLTIAELVPAVPEGDNGGAEVVRLCGALQQGKIIPSEAPPPQMRMVAPGKAMRGAARPEWLTQGDKRKILTNRWETVTADMEVNQQTLEELRTALKKPVLYKRLNYEAGFENLDMNHLMNLKRGGQWLAASGINQIHRGNEAGVLEDIAALVALLRMQESEHLAINQLVRWAIQYLAVAVTWEALESDGWDDRALERMQRVWTGLDFVGPVVAALRMERAMGRLPFDEARHSTDKLSDVRSNRDASLMADVWTGSVIPSNGSGEGRFDIVIRFIADSAPEAAWKGILFPMWQFAWSYEDERQNWKNFQTLIDATQTAAQRGSARLIEKAHAELEQTSEPKGLDRLRLLISSPMSGALLYLPSRAFQAQTHAEMVVCAIALKRYRLKHGEYPNQLDELVPAFLPKHPVDYMDGGKLRYRRADDNFTLWSVGTNSNDDGGDPGALDNDGKPLQMWKAPDAVWPRPASDGEIRESEERKFGK